MTNGELMSLVMQILKEDKEIPDISAKATARLTLAGMVPLYRKVEDSIECIKTNTNDIGILKADNKERKERRKKEEDARRKLWYSLIGGCLLLAINVLVQVFK